MEIRMFKQRSELVAVKTRHNLWASHRAPPRESRLCVGIVIPAYRARVQILQRQILARDIAWIRTSPPPSQISLSRRRKSRGHWGMHCRVPDDSCCSLRTRRGVPRRVASCFAKRAAEYIYDRSASARCTTYIHIWYAYLFGERPRAFA